jgi:hypothetical protein
MLAAPLPTVLKVMPFLRSLLMPLAAPLLLAALAGCAALEYPLAQPGQTEAQAVATMGPLTARYTLPSGQQRLEFAKGPYGRYTWMVDLDAQGRVASLQQVLTAAQFALARDGLPRDELLHLLGTPADRAREGQQRETWSWRYATNDCLWVRITLGADGRVIGGASTMTDPRCDINDR